MRTFKSTEAVQQHRLGSDKDLGKMQSAETIAEVQPTDNHTTRAQASRLIAALRCGPISTIDAAQCLDIVHPPAAVRWLRNRGYSIKTEWTYKTTEPGRRPHRVGLYVLASEPS
nr:helix-turn-helix domain-containing protein [Pseudomonas carnis]